MDNVTPVQGAGRGHCTPPEDSGRLLALRGSTFISARFLCFLIHLLKGQGNYRELQEKEASNYVPNLTVSFSSRTGPYPRRMLRVPSWIFPDLHLISSICTFIQFRKGAPLF